MLNTTVPPKLEVFEYLVIAIACALVIAAVLAIGFAPKQEENTHEYHS